MKICHTCNKTVGDWKYCPYCGTKLDVIDLTYQNTDSLLRQNVVFHGGTQKEAPGTKPPAPFEANRDLETEKKEATPVDKAKETHKFEIQDVFSQSEEIPEQPSAESGELISEDEMQKDEAKVEDEVPLNLSGLFGQLQASPPPESKGSDASSSEITETDNGELSDDLFASDNTQPEPISQINHTADEESFSGFSQPGYDSEKITEDVFSAELTVQKDRNEEPCVRNVPQAEPFEPVAQQKKPFEPVKAKTKPVLSASGIDPMFGEAPSFDIERIKEAYRAENAKEKKKPAKWFFGRNRK